MAGLREQKKKETKAAIVAAAVTLFGKCGYENTSISALAEAAGVGKGTVYSYFKSKDEILLAFCEEDLASLRQEINQKMDPDSSLEEKLVLIFMSEFRYITKNTEFGRILMRELIFPKGITVEKSQDLENQFIKLFIEIFQEAQKNGQLRNDLDLLVACYHFYAIYIIVLSTWYSDRSQSEEDVRSLMQVMFEQAMTGLKPTSNN